MMFNFRKLLVAFISILSLSNLSHAAWTSDNLEILDYSIDSSSEGTIVHIIVENTHETDTVNQPTVTVAFNKGSQVVNVSSSRKVLMDSGVVRDFVIETDLKPEDFDSHRVYVVGQFVFDLHKGMSSTSSRGEKVYYDENDNPVEGEIAIVENSMKVVKHESLTENYYLITGELVNNTNAIVFDVFAAFLLVDSNDEVNGVGSSHIEYNPILGTLINPGESRPFIAVINPYLPIESEIRSMTGFEAFKIVGFENAEQENEIESVVESSSWGMIKNLF